MTQRSETLLEMLQTNFDKTKFKKLNWSGGFNDYLDIVSENPAIISSAWMRMYNMIVSKGVEEVVLFRRKYKKYNFFGNHKEFPIFGLEGPLEEFVDTLHAGALGYGPEKRVLLFHGPVGSSKSTICTLIKRGLEEYSRSDEGALYTYSWDLQGTEIANEGNIVDCPIHEDPINLIPGEARGQIIQEIMSGLPSEEKFELDTSISLCPKCQYYFDYFMKKYDGDFTKVLDHINVSRFIFDEKTRKGIGTFQPKDEKNQDSTELTGDINFRKLGQIGVDSDPRCFNFDGEFQIANRGVCEFIEVLKLSKEFLYDLLGASQEKQIKPKKFSQMNIDEVLIGHSVHGDTPIPHEYNGVLDVLPISALKSLPVSKVKVFSVNEKTKKVELTEIKSVFSHDFAGDWIVNEQAGKEITTTPNHSVYNENYETFYPGEDDTTNILQVHIPEELIKNKETTERWFYFFHK